MKPIYGIMILSSRSMGYRTINSPREPLVIMLSSAYPNRQTRVWRKHVGNNALQFLEEN